jgi:hypothetical protein
VDAAADVELRRLQPCLCGQGALVNVGPLKLTWPRSSDAACQGTEVPDGEGQHSVAGPSQPAPPSDGTRRPPAELSQQELVLPTGCGRSLTAGPSSGRTVKDTGDW